MLLHKAFKTPDVVALQCLCRPSTPVPFRAYDAHPKDRHRRLSPRKGTRTNAFSRSLCSQKSTKLKAMCLHWYIITFSMAPLKAHKNLSPSAEQESDATTCAANQEFLPRTNA
jgi:hypothetical protein